MTRRAYRANKNSGSSHFTNNTMQYSRPHSGASRKQDHFEHTAWYLRVLGGSRNPGRHYNKHRVDVSSLRGEMQRRLAVSVAVKAVCTRLTGTGQCTHREKASQP